MLKGCATSKADWPTEWQNQYVVKCECYSRCILWHLILTHCWLIICSVNRPPSVLARQWPNILIHLIFFHPRGAKNEPSIMSTKLGICNLELLNRLSRKGLAMCCDLISSQHISKWSGVSFSVFSTAVCYLCVTAGCSLARAVNLLSYTCFRTLHIRTV